MMIRHFSIHSTSALCLFVLFGLCVSAGFPVFSAPIPMLEGIRVGDYVNYTQVVLEYAGGKLNSTVSTISQNPPIVVIKVKGLMPGLTGPSYATHSLAFNKITITQSSGDDLLLTIPVSNNVDLQNLHCCSWQGMVTVDLPFKQPDYTKFPSPDQIRDFKNKGGHVIVIDPGHGGFDPGAQGGAVTRSPHLVEKNVVLSLAKKLKKVLDKDPHFMTVLTRDGDYLPAPCDVEGTKQNDYRKASLLHRVELAKEFQGDIYLSFHLNAPVSSKYHRSVRGFEVFYFDENSAADLMEDWRDNDEFDTMGVNKGDWDSFILTAIKKDNYPQKSKLLAGAITQEMGTIPEVSLRDPAIKSKRLRVLKQLNMPSILIEFLFLTHPIEHEFIRQEKNQDRVVNAVYKGVCQYFFEPVNPASGKPSVIAMKTPPDEEPATVEDDTPPPVVGKEKQPSTKIHNSAKELAGSQPVPKTMITGPVQKTQIPSPKPEPANTAVVTAELIPPAEATAPKTAGEISIPVSAPVSAPAPVSPKEHTVRPGDSVFSIAKHYGVELENLRTANKELRSTKDRISIGQKLIIPQNTQIQGTAPANTKMEIPLLAGTTPAPAKSEQVRIKGTAPSASKSVSTEIKEYEVRPGDTLEKIAMRFNTSIDTIKDLNKIKKSEIFPGDKLKIKPAKANSRLVTVAKPQTYEVQDGDTLDIIAKRYKTSVNTIKQANSLRNSMIHSGQVLQIQ